MIAMRNAAAMFLLIIAATPTIAQETIIARQPSFACRNIEHIQIVGMIIRFGTTRQLKGFLDAAIEDGVCRVTLQGARLTVERRIQDAAFCVRRPGDSNCSWMPGEAFDPAR
jgi:hypothetical protein